MGRAGRSSGMPLRAGRDRQRDPHEKRQPQSVTASHSLTRLIHIIYYTRVLSYHSESQ